MRQVPHKPKYLLIGDGKMALHTRHYFDLLKIPYSQWSRRNNSTSELPSQTKKADIVLLLIKDDQILPFLNSHFQKDTLYVHFSGSLESDLIIGFHPLMSFGKKSYSLETYKSIEFVGSENPSLFQSLFPCLPNHYSQISKDKKSLYHSLCVLGGNGTTLLWHILESKFEEMGLPKKALDVYLLQVTQNIIEHNEGRFTGPWYRNDQITLQKNKKSLEQQHLTPLYSELEKLSKTLGQHNEIHTGI